MERFLLLSGSIAGIGGTLVCGIAGLARLTGYYHLAGFESTTLFSVGTGMMVFACMTRLELLLARDRHTTR